MPRVRAQHQSLVGRRVQRILRAPLSGRRSVDASAARRSENYPARTQLETGSNDLPEQVLPSEIAYLKKGDRAMRSEPLPGEARRRRAEEQFKTTKKINSETKANSSLRQAEAEKTARLRALRLAKEAADKDTAERDATAAKALKSGVSRRVPGPRLKSVRTKA